MIVNNKNDRWVLKAMAHKYNSPYHIGFDLEIWQQDNNTFITVFMISIWKFYAGIFLTRLPKRMTK